MRISVFIMMALVMACEPMDEFYRQIEELGYIPLKAPLEHAASGTMVRGSPDQLIFVSPSDSCFPVEDDGSGNDNQPVGILNGDNQVPNSKDHTVGNHDGYKIAGTGGKHLLNNLYNKFIKGDYNLNEIMVSSLHADKTKGVTPSHLSKILAY